MNKVLNPKLIAILFSIILCIVVFFACKKLENITTEKKPIPKVAQFFEISEGTDSAVASIISNIKRQDDTRHFVDSLITKAGYAIWNKAKVIIGEPGKGKQIFIPFVLEKTKQTRAILIVKLNGVDTLYRLLYAASARSFKFDEKKDGSWNAKDIFHAFILFDNDIFGHTKFTVNNGRFVNDTTGAAHSIEIAQIGNDAASYRPQTSYLVTVNITFMVCGLCGFKETEVNSDRCCNATYYTQPISYWFDDGNNNWGYNTPSGGFEGGAEPCPGCSWEDTNPCDIEPPYTTICDAEWQPTLHNPAFNPINYDTVGISTGLETKYPCAAAFISDSLPNINFLAQLAGASVFKDSAYMHLTFDTSTVYTTAGQYAAVTTSTAAPFVNGDGVTEYSGVIQLNPWYLKHGTKEYMVANILHETMHAIFNVRWKQYTTWLQYHDNPIDSNYMKTRFPMYWYAIQNQTSPLTPEQDHEIMAESYLNTFSSLLLPFYNPNASTAIRDTVIKAMAYDGLHSTTAWKALPSQGVDTCKYKSIQLASEKSLTSGTEYPTGCTGTTPFHYSNDLKLRPSCN